MSPALLPAAATTGIATGIAGAPVPQAGPAEASIRVEAVARSFSTGGVTARVLNGVSFALHPGEMTLIVGPSGSGKSTLLAVASGLLRPSEGKVTALGKDLWAMSNADIDAFRLAHCGFVFQGFNLFAALTAAEQVLYPLKFSGLVGEAAQERVRDAMASVGLAAKAHLLPLQLSGGEKQRVAIARAIAKRPKLLFADEPTSALDKDNGARIARLLHDLARAPSTSVLCVSHYPRLIDHADRVIRIEDGAIIGDERRAPLPIPAAAKTA